MSVYMHFVSCPKQGLEIEGVVLQRVGYTFRQSIFVLSRVRISNPQ